MTIDYWVNNWLFGLQMIIWLTIDYLVDKWLFGWQLIFWLTIDYLVDNWLFGWQLIIWLPSERLDSYRSVAYSYNKQTGDSSHKNIFSFNKKLFFTINISFMDKKLYLHTSYWMSHETWKWKEKNLNIVFDLRNKLRHLFFNLLFNYYIWPLLQLSFFVGHHLVFKTSVQSFNWNFKNAI